MATFWVYDYACSLHEEWTFLLQSHWSKVKGLYIATRYLPFIILTTSLYLGFTPGGNPGKCRVFYNINTGFFIIRTYVLWNNNRILLTTMLSIFFMRLARSRASQGATRAQLVSSSSYHFFSFSRSNWVGNQEHMCSWRISPTRLYVALVKHNIFYYICGFLFSVMNIFASMLLHFVILAVLATRMHLHLWQISQRAHGSGALVYIPMSDLSSVNSTA
ncbi:uncharacterized protein BJ212DRAFT_1302249 [Suillus subaureus]|uniref:DUF6533 domain-containing protein n=1 Tax=Suillus subaureus TaxID=48587 RepID=A0A9P7JAG1_9AGAM|nr:uncharacterized protein BJ212DRAFT_1302249 [Suillus subaureus]KAG1810936.1 hypothetical protein BJ212DRAFT_1302249 [Suillus subaureus]